MEVRVVRHSFYNKENQYLRYSEEAPPVPPKEGSICGCTQAVAEKPFGRPHQVNQEILLETKTHQQHARISLDGEHVNFTLWWEGRKEHAYYWFYPAQNRLQIEITIPGYGLADCFFGHLYFGNQVDTSRLMNGHSPSRILLPTQFRSEDIWAHECSWGKEAYEHFPVTVEWYAWRALKSLTDHMDKVAKRYLEPGRTVEEIRQSVLTSDVLPSAAEHLRIILEGYQRHFLDTEHYKLCHRLAQQCEKHGLQRV